MQIFFPKLFCQLEYIRTRSSNQFIWNLKLRIILVGGILIWNIAYGYEHFGKDFEHYEEIIEQLVQDKKWEFFCPIRNFHKMQVFITGQAIKENNILQLSFSC